MSTITGSGSNAHYSVAPSDTSARGWIVPRECTEHRPPAAHLREPGRTDAVWVEAWRAIACSSERLVEKTFVRCVASTFCLDDIREVVVVEHHQKLLPARVEMSMGLVGFPDMRGSTHPRHLFLTVSEPGRYLSIPI